MNLLLLLIGIILGRIEYDVNPEKDIPTLCMWLVFLLFAYILAEIKTHLKK
jgi:hypothetical protein